MCWGLSIIELLKALCYGFLRLMTTQATHWTPQGYCIKYSILLSTSDQHIAL